MLNTWQIFWQFSQMKHDYSKLKKRVTSLLKRQQTVKIIFKRLITLDTSYMMSCLVWRCCSEVLLPDLIVISWETWADTHALSTGVVLMKEWVISVYDLETAEEEWALSSLIIWSDLTYMTCLIWLRVGTAIIKRVLIRDEAADLVWRV